MGGVALTCDLACVSAPAECPCQRRQQVVFLGAGPVGSYGGHTWVIVVPHRRLGGFGGSPHGGRGGG